MRHVHHILSTRVSWYHRWHQHPHHAHRHWLVAGVSCLVGAYAVLGAWQVALVEQEFLFAPLAVAQAQSEPAGADGTTFSERKAAWLAREGKSLNNDWDSSPNRGFSFLFAWMEAGKYFTSQAASAGTVHDMIQQLYPESGSAGSTAGLTLFRLYAQYEDVLKGGTVNGNTYPASPNDYQAIENHLKTKVRSHAFVSTRLGAGNDCSAQPTETVVSYLFTLTDTSATFTYDTGQTGEWTSPPPSAGSGTVYLAGQTYNTHQYAYDVLRAGIEKCYLGGNGELEGGGYTWRAIHGLILLYDFADRVCTASPASPLCIEGKGMKDRAKMAIDLMLLDELMDFSANHHAGATGRNYRDNILDAEVSYALTETLFGLPPKYVRGTDGGVFVSTYRPTPLMYSLIVGANTAGPGYWHFQKENNSVSNMDGGKWAFIHPWFNLGGVDSSTPNWLLTLRSAGGAGMRAGQPFLLWIDSNDWSGDHCGDANLSPCNKNWSQGSANFFQYRNAAIVSRSTMRLHVAQSNSFDEGQGNLQALNVAHANCRDDATGATGVMCTGNYTLNNSGWQFFREGNVGIAMQMASGQAAIEVVALDASCSADHCYPSTAAFKDAVNNNASFDSNSFTTSRGVTISAGGTIHCGLTNPGDCVFPFDRMETESSEGKLIDWNNNIMTVSKGGQQCAYNFNAWTYGGNGCGPAPIGSVTPPGPGPIDDPGPSPLPSPITCANCPLKPFLAYCGTSAASCSAVSPTPSPSPGPSPGLSQCSDGIDNDADGETDYPADTDCTSLAGTQEGTVPAPTGKKPEGSYPLIGWQTFGGPSGAVEDFYARFSLLATTIDDPAFIARIRQINVNHINPAIKVVWTYDWNTARDIDTNGPGPLPDEWILKDSQGNKLTSYGSTQMMNLSEFGPPAPPGSPYAGKTYRQYVAEHFANRASLSVYDGWGTMGAWGPTNQHSLYEKWPDVDINNNERNDRDGEFVDVSTWETSWEKGLDQILAGIRTRLDAAGPGKLLLINSGAQHRWGWPQTNGIIDEKLNGYFDSKDKFSNEYWSAFSAQGMKPLASLADGLPFLFCGDGFCKGGEDVSSCALDCPGPSDTKNDFRGMRFGLVTSMFNDVYYSFQGSEATEHYWSHWYDEFDADLGAPSGPPQMIRAGAWVRFFQKGAAIASTDGSPQTITSADLMSVSGYAGPYFRFFGGQDPAMNNGAQFTSITLKGELVGNRRMGDGLILFKQPTSVIADIIVDTDNSATSPGSVPAALSGFAVQTSCSNVQTFYKTACRNSPLARAYAYASDLNASAQFIPTIGVGGQYEVFEWHGRVSAGSGATQVRHTITHAGGTAAPIVNQSLNVGQWNSLGTFRFNAGTSGKVVIAPVSTDDSVIADAIMFRYIAP